LHLVNYNTSKFGSKTLVESEVSMTASMTLISIIGDTNG
jgi:hypothetical protein